MTAQWKDILSDIKTSTRSRNPPVDFNEKNGRFPDITYYFFKSEIKVVKQVFESIGLRAASSNSCILWSTSKPKTSVYQSLGDHQWINHYPYTSELTRKDRLCYNIRLMKEEFGLKKFNITPEGYVLPEDLHELCTDADPRSKWIVKPPASSQGRGIYLVNSIEEINFNKPAVVSRYIENPLLVKGYKFDLRVYVVVTSYDPLRIYMYNEGLARFASEKYSSNKNKFSHLTNYSINKKNSKFVKNLERIEEGMGHKWSMTALFKVLRQNNIDTEKILENIHSVIIKTILSSEEPIVEAGRRLGISSVNCFDLFGFDILIDSNLKPWMLEVNLSPSLGIDTPLDEQVKSQLIRDTFNLVGIRKIDSKSRLQFKPNGNVSKAKYLKKPSNFMEILRDTLEEFERKGNFTRIYPSYGTCKYDEFLSYLHMNSYIYNTLFPYETVPKVRLTGDDILIEYINRIYTVLKVVDEGNLQKNWRNSLERFVGHPIWYDPDPVEESLPQRVARRIYEMQKRRKNIAGNALDEEALRKVLKKFSPGELENMILNSCNNSAADIVSSLFEDRSAGLLSRINNWMDSRAYKFAPISIDPIVQAY